MSASCCFCKTQSERLKSCVCGKVSYCGEECQTSDWKTHKVSCPPYTIKDVPGKGRAVVATRKIKPGQIIMEELPLLTGHANVPTLLLVRDIERQLAAMDPEIRAKLLDQSDPLDEIPALDLEAENEDGGGLKASNPRLNPWRQVANEEVRKVLRIFFANASQMCKEPEVGDVNVSCLYLTISFINHSCNPNVIRTWVKGDIKRKQVRAVKNIEKGEEILVSKKGGLQFNFGSRDYRRQVLLEEFAFICKCPECSLEGQDYEENEHLRSDIREKQFELYFLLGTLSDGRSCHLDPQPDINLKLQVDMLEELTELIKRLDLQTEIARHLIMYCVAALEARDRGVEARDRGGVEARDRGVEACPDPEPIRQEALVLSRRLGDEMLRTFSHLDSCRNCLHFGY